jgi:hypothetical protein
MKSFDKTNPEVMIRMLKLIQAICVLYYGNSKMTEEDRQAAINFIFEISHVIVDTADHNHKDWIDDVLGLENGLTKTGTLKEIDKIYKNHFHEK